MVLFERLEKLGFRVWYDNGVMADHRNLQGMKAGVRASECLLIFASGRKETRGRPSETGEYEGVMTRWFCQEEMATAHAESIRCIGVMETDPRHCEPDFGLEKSRARSGGKAGGPVHMQVEQNLRLLDEVCFIPFRRQVHEVGAMLTEIARQAAMAPCLVPLQPSPEPELMMPSDAVSVASDV